MSNTARRFSSSISWAVALISLACLFIFVNFVASRRYWRHDFSKQQITKLSDQTREVLNALKEPLSVIVFYQPSHRLYELVKDQLKEYERASPKVRVEYVDPQQDIARARQLVKDFQIDVNSQDSLNLVIFQSAARHKYLSDTDLADYDYAGLGMGGEPRVKAFKGESAFTSAILSVTQATQPLVWIATGHGEKSLEAEEPNGLSNFKKALEQQNMSVKSVNLLEQAEIPAEVKLVILAGPARQLAEQEVKQLEQYLEKGGRLLALVDPLTEPGLDGLFSQWGVQLGKDIVVDPERRLPFVSAANLFVTTYTEHPIVTKMKTLMTLFPLARSVRQADSLPPAITVSPLALTSEAGWGETQTDNERFQFNAGQDLKGPVSIAVAVERGQPKTRLVVVGDSDFIMNAQINNVGNRDLVMGMVYWLTEQEQFIGIGPKPIESIKLNATGKQVQTVFFFCFLGFPLAFGACGLAVWWQRRQ